METISYATGMFWFTSWPILIYVSYKFAFMNLEHFEENINR
jgi:hypothetical protein